MDTQLFMPLSDFKDIYYDFRRRRGLPPQRWIREHWQSTFNDLGLTIERSQREYRGVRSTADWLVGLDATVNSHGQSLIVTRDMVKQLELDESRIDGELKHIREKISVAQKLCEVEEEVTRLKTLRTDLRLILPRVLIRCLHPCFAFLGFIVPHAQHRLNVTIRLCLSSAERCFRRALHMCGVPCAMRKRTSAARLVVTDGAVSWRHLVSLLGPQKNCDVSLSIVFFFNDAFQK